MSRIEKYKEMLTHLTNEDYKKAEELFHTIVVESARDIYGEIVSEADDEDDELGGDMGDDFISDIEAGEEEIETDELHDGEVETGDEFGDDEEELDTEDRVEELEAQLEELRAEFENLMKGELDEPYHDEEDFDNIDSDGEFEDDEDDEFGDELRGDDEFDFEGDELEEATKFSNDVSVDMSKEGQLAGTGAKSDKPNLNTKSTYASAGRTEKEPKGKGPVKFGGGDEKGEKTAKPSKQKSSTNVKEVPKSVKQSDQRGEGKYVGTGKGSKAGKLQTKSPLSKKPA